MYFTIFPIETRLVLLLVATATTHHTLQIQRLRHSIRHQHSIAHCKTRKKKKNQVSNCN